MRRKIVLLSLIFLVAGIVMIVAGLGITSNYITISHSYVHNNGLYESKEINISAEGLISINGNIPMYLVSSNNITLVNSTNIKNYSLDPVGEKIANAGYEFTVNRGSYYLVSLENPSSANIYSYVNNFVFYSEIGTILLVGIIIMGISLITLIIGFILREKKDNKHDNT